MIRILAIATFMAAGSAAAQDAAGYKCTIKHSLSLANDGSPEPSPAAKAFHNQEFIVDRQSGRMLGKINSEGWDKYEVWDRGSSAQSYKAFYAHALPICCRSKSLNAETPSRSF
jgi:hypothetical protein